MKRAVLILVALALLLGSIGRARADIFTFTVSDTSGDAGHGILSATPAPGFGTNAFLATSGTLDVTSGFAMGTYTLLPVGPSPTLSPSGAFQVDDLVFPSNNGGSYIPPPSFLVPISNPSFLSNGGLLFTPGGSNPGSQTELAIWGNGGGDYAFIGLTGTLLAQATPPTWSCYRTNACPVSVSSLC